MAKEKESRPSKWFDSPLNSYIRNQIEDKAIKTDDFAKTLGVSIEAVRQWCAGYSRPDIDKLPVIAKYFNVSIDYLLGHSTVKSISVKVKAVCEFTGLCEEAIGFFTDAKAARDDRPKLPHIYDDYLNIINSLFKFQKPDVERILACMREYAYAMSDSEKARDEVAKFACEQHDNHFKEKEKEEGMLTREQWIERDLKVFDRAINDGLPSVSTYFRAYVVNERKAIVQAVRSSRFDVTDSIHALIKNLTEKMLERIRSKEAADNAET